MYLIPFALGAKFSRPSSVGFSKAPIKSCLISNQCGKIENETEVANTLLARDYKGFGNQGMNGVIEKHNEKFTN